MTKLMNDQIRQNVRNRYQQIAAPEIKNDLNELYSGCISGASSIIDLTSMLQQSGFTDISIEPKDESKSFIKDWVPGANVDNYITSAVIKAVKQ